MSDTSTPRVLRHRRCKWSRRRAARRAERLRNETFWLEFLQDELPAQQKANK